MPHTILLVRLFVAAALLAVSIGCLHAQVQWEPANAGAWGATSVGAVRSGADGALLVLVRGIEVFGGKSLPAYTLYRSTDRGTSWTRSTERLAPVAAAIPGGIVLAEINVRSYPDYYIESARTFFRSEAGEISPIDLFGDADVKVAADSNGVAVVGVTHVYGLGHISGGASLTIDSGASWRRVLDLPTSAAAVAPDGSAYIATYIFSDAGSVAGTLYRIDPPYDDTVEIMLDDIVIQSLVATPDGTLIADAFFLTKDSVWPDLDPWPERRGIYRSTDGGATWGMLIPDESPAGWSPHYYRRLAATPEGSLLLEGTPGLRSTDNGETWEALSIALSRPHLAEAADGSLLLLSSGTLYRSVDEGAPWDPLNADFHPFNSFAVTPDGIIVAGTDGVGLFRTSRFLTAPEIVATKGDPSSLAFSVVFDPADGTARAHLHMNASGRVALRVYDALGRSGAPLFEGKLTAGDHVIPIAFGGLRSGTWLIVAEGDGVRAAQLLVVR